MDYFNLCHVEVQQTQPEADTQTLVNFIFWPKGGIAAVQIQTK